MGRTRIVGIVRFSVLSTRPSPFHAYRERTFEEITAAIRDEARLVERFRLFEAICLPALDGQDDPDFQLLVVAPRLLPPRWKSRLAFLASERPYVRLHYADETDFLIADCSKIVFDMLETRGLFFTFRLDDDDALARTFVSRARSYLVPPLAGHGLSFCKGYFFQIRDEAYRISQQIRPNIGAGLGFISSGRTPQTIFDISELHPGLPKRVPVITDATRDSFLVTAHGSNDSGKARPVDEAPMSTEQAAKALRQLGFTVELELLDHLRKMPPPAGSCLELAKTLRGDPLDDLQRGLEGLTKPTRQQIAARRAGRRQARGWARSFRDFGRRLLKR